MITIEGKKAGNKLMAFNLKIKKKGQQNALFFSRSENHFMEEIMLTLRIISKGKSVYDWEVTDDLYEEIVRTLIEAGETTLVEYQGERGKVKDLAFTVQIAPYVDLEEE